MAAGLTVARDRLEIAEAFLRAQLAKLAEPRERHIARDRWRAHSGERNG